MSMILTLSGMSTSGKSTLAKALTSVAPDCFEETISVTTRKMRPGEINGREYYFVEEAEFKDFISKNLLTEYVNSHSAYYGTLKSEISRIMGKGKSVVMVLEPQGVSNIHKVAQQSDHWVHSCFLEVDLETLLQRFFARIGEQKEKGLSLDLLKEADRMETILIKERAWSDILPWDKRLSNLHINGELDSAIDNLMDLHLGKPEPSHSAFDLRDSDVRSKVLSADILIGIIEDQVRHPISYKKLADKVETLISTPSSPAKNEDQYSLSGLNL